VQTSDVVAFVTALVVTAAFTLGIVWVWNHWAALPSWLAMLLFILLAVAVIGYPIYAFAQWSNRYVERLQQARKPGAPPPERGNRS